jgi:Putative Flp pilus-assembly TadE/G-like
MNLPNRQRGITLVLIAVAMLALIAIAGLALDVGHLVLDKARLQATVDAAAVTGAKVLDNTGSAPQAAIAADRVFRANAFQFPELARSGVRPLVRFSNSPNFFGFGGGGTPQYVRVTADGLDVPATLSAVLHFNRFFLSAQAVAGPSPTLSNACNVTPLMICGSAPTPGNPVYGYYVGQVIGLTLSSGTPQAAAGINYLTLSSGANSEEQDIGGAYPNCSSVGNTPNTSTGTVPAPVGEGLDTRFDEYLAGDLTSNAYPPDVIITQPAGIDRFLCSNGPGSPTCGSVMTGAGAVITTSSQIPNYNYENMYLPRVQAANYDVPPAPAGPGVVNRRVLAVPVGDCTASTPAGGPVPVLGFACVFTLQDVDQTTGQVFGEVLQSCQVNGVPPRAPTNAPGPYSIELYHINGSPQS